jgi:uncharacterized membrane protein
MLGLIISPLAILGAYGIFTNNFTFFIIGAIAAIVELIIGIFTGQLKSLFTIIIAIIMGVIYATINGLSIVTGILIGLCIESAIMGFFGLLTYGIMIIGIILNKDS